MRALAAVVAMLAFAIAPAGAFAAEHPPFDGTMSIPVIHSPADPEEYTWEVQLGEGQTLELVDDQRAVVRWEGGEVAFEISAAPAHDAAGAAVPTTLSVSEGNLLTLTVHHRAGNPAAGGAPFAYPISQGPGWEGGFQTQAVAMPPPDPIATPAPRCSVPRLAGRSLKASRKLLRRSNCRLGPVRGERSRAAKVVRQYRKPGRSLPAGAAVGVKLG